MNSHNKQIFALTIFVVVGVWPASMIVAQTAIAPLVATAPPPPDTTKAPEVPYSGQPSAFSQMGVRERTAILTELRQQGPEYIFQAMLDSGKIEHDPTKQSAIATLLSTVIRQNHPSAEFMTKMRQFILDDSGPRWEREMTIDALGHAATEETTDILIYAANNMQDAFLKGCATDEISLAGEGPDGTQIDPMLEKVWGSSHNSRLLSAVATSMARIGTASSAQMLVDAAFGPQDKDNRKGIAFAAMDDLRSPNAVPPLAVQFDKNTPGTLEFQMIGDTLVQIGDATAAQALLARLQTLDDHDAMQASEWVRNAQGPAMRQVFAAAAANSAATFRSDKIREAIRAGVAGYPPNRAAPAQSRASQ